MNPKADAINALLKDAQQFRPGHDDGPRRGNGATDDADAGMPRVYNMAALAARPAVVRKWVIDSWLPAGTNAVFGGHGGVGKSLLMAMLAVCVAAGKPFFGLAVQKGNVLIYSCEDDVDEWIARMRAAATYLDVEFCTLAITLIDALDTNHDAALFAPPAEDARAESQVTMVGLWLAEQVAAIRPTLIILDSGTDTFSGNENNRRDVRRYLRMTRRLLASIGACVVHILHVDKKSVRGGAIGDHYSGVTDWNNGVRARLAFYRPPTPDAGDGEDDDSGSSDEPLRLELQKANYAPHGAYVDLRYDTGQRVFVKVGGSDTISGTDMISGIRNRNDRRVVLRALAEAQDAGDAVHSAERANRNAAVRLAAVGSLPSTFRGKTGKRRLFKLLLKLKAEGMLSEVEVRTASRNYANAWNVTPCGREACA